MESPFQCKGKVQEIGPIGAAFNLMLRVENIQDAAVVYKKNGDPSAGQDYILYAKDEHVIAGDDQSIYSFINIDGDPKLYWQVVRKQSFRL